MNQSALKRFDYYNSILMILIALVVALSGEAAASGLLFASSSARTIETHTDGRIPSADSLAAKLG
jgi:hypothetical protein